MRSKVAWGGHHRITHRPAILMKTDSRVKPTFWAIQYGEARGHSIVAALILWIGIGIVMVAGPGHLSITGSVKGTDFVHFYTLGRQVLAGRGADLYDSQAQFDFQRSLIPESGGARYLPVYPPQTALLFAPFAQWSYGTGAFLWISLTIAIYAAIVWVLRRTSLSSIQDTTFLVSAAAAFPPLTQLVLHGQTTVVPLVSFFLGWRALERGRMFLAGFALGFLAIKPQFGLALAVVAIACREWRLTVGAVTAMCMQVAVVDLSLGGSVLMEYFRTLQALSNIASLLEPRPYQLHSLRSLTALLPEPIAFPAWILSIIPVLVMSVLVWRAELPVSVRFGMLVIASVLVNPHLTVYDATVLILPLAWIGGWVLNEGCHEMDTRRFWTGVYGLYLFLLFPTAYVVGVQASVPLLCWLFFSVAFRTLTSPARGISTI